MRFLRVVRPLIPVIVMTLIAACTRPSSTVDRDLTSDIVITDSYTELAVVEAIEIRQSDTFPIQVTVNASGNLPNSCSVVDQVDQNHIGSTYRVNISVIHQAKQNCEPSLVPFEHEVSLDVLGLPAGVYVIDVNGLQGTFTIQEDNVLDERNAVLGGRIWSDHCLIYGNEGDTFGCRENSDGFLVANGIQEFNEPGIAGVVINLGAGSCPSTSLASAMTDAEGHYLFSGLRGGTYCLSVDTYSEVNTAVLEVGEWTYPTELFIGSKSVLISKSDSMLDLNFGWSTLSVESEPDALDAIRTDCLDAVTFVTDVSIPDDTEVSPTKFFTKTWQLGNAGTCTWQPGYSLVFADGDLMEGPNFMPLGETIFPGETVKISVALVAPEEPGSYRGEWMLRNGKGLLFGIGPEADAPFWVQIFVTE